MNKFIAPILAGLVLTGTSFAAANHNVVRAPQVKICLDRSSNKCDKPTKPTSCKENPRLSKNCRGGVHPL